LEAHHREEESVGVDVQVLVDEVEAVLFAVVAEDVLLFVGVAQFHDLAPDQVADAPSKIDKCEAVWGDPEPALNGLLVFIDEVECFLEPVLTVLLFKDSLGDGLVDGLSIKLEQVESVL